MASKEEDTPSYIDYSGASTNPSTWNGQDVINCFLSELGQKGISVVIDSMKDRSLARKMASEYSPEELAIIIRKWVINANRLHVHKFNFLYMNRHSIATKAAKKDYTWE